MKQFKLIVVAVLALLGLIVVLQNTASVETKILFVTIIMPRAILLMITLLIGFVLGIFASLLRVSKKQPDHE